MKKKIIKVVAFVIALVACLAILVGLKYQFSHKTCPASLGLRGLERGKGTDVLFIGSSMTRASYDLKLFEKRSGRRGYVMSYNAMDPKFSYPLLRYILEETDLKPETVVLEGASTIVCVESRLRDDNLFYHAPPKLKSAYLDIIEQDGAASAEPESTDLWVQIGGDKEARDRLRDRRRYDWRDKCKLLIASKAGDIIFSPITNRLVGPYYYRGAFVAGPGGHIKPGSFDKIKAQEMDKGEFRQEQVEALQSIFALLKKHQVEGVFVLPPLPAGVMRDTEVQNATAKLRKLIEDAGFRYIDGTVDFPNDDPTNYLDSRHLSRAGRKRFTGRIAELLAKPEPQVK